MPPSPDPTPTDPAPTEPAPTDPAPTDPAPSDPAQAGDPSGDDYGTNQVIAGFARMSAEEFAAMIPPEGMRLCSREASRVSEIYRSPDRGCHTVTAAEVTPGYWRSTLRAQVSGNRRVRCEPDAVGERCTTPPVHNDPPNGRVWYMTVHDARRQVVRVVGWSIDG